MCVCVCVVLGGWMGVYNIMMTIKLYSITHSALKAMVGDFFYHYEAMNAFEMLQYVFRVLMHPKFHCAFHDHANSALSNRVRY